MGKSHKGMEIEKKYIMEEQKRGCLKNETASVFKYKEGTKLNL